MEDKEDTDLPNGIDKYKRYTKEASKVNNVSFPDFKIKANFEILYQAL